VEISKAQQALKIASNINQKRPKAIKDAKSIENHSTSSRMNPNHLKTAKIHQNAARCIEMRIKNLQNEAKSRNIEE